MLVYTGSGTNNMNRSQITHMKMATLSSRLPETSLMVNAKRMRMGVCNERTSRKNKNQNLKQILIQGMVWVYL